MKARLSLEELQQLAEITNGVWSIEEDAQCLNIDGVLYVHDILEMADYIRGITQHQKQ